jgi:hypothetical protein
MRQLKPHNGLTRSLKAELLSLIGPAGLEIPVCAFDGWVRSVFIDEPMLSKIFDAAFPGFRAGEQNYHDADFFTGRYRRFAGADTLPRGVYTAVCRWDRSDGGGLVREIFAYAQPEITGIVLVDDMSDPQDAAGINARYGSQFEAGEYLLVCTIEPEKLVPTEWSERAKVNGELPNFFMAPCVTEHKRLERVVDLRLRRVQDWFFKTFSHNEFLNIPVPLPKVNSFLELLPFLLGQHRGGNDLTQAVGRELRLWGVDGLVYPSARCDTVVVVEHGNVVDWYGWNVVDYSKGREQDPKFNPRDAATLLKKGDLAKDLQHGHKYFGAPRGDITIDYYSEGPKQGTWQVVGLEALNKLAWMKKLSPAQRELLRMPADEDRISSSEKGVDEVEKLFRRRFLELLEAKGQLGLNRDTVRSLLATLARGLMEVPFGGSISISREKLVQILGAESQVDAFTEIASGMGFLIQEPKGYFRFADNNSFEYFTSLG